MARRLKYGPYRVEIQPALGKPSKFCGGFVRRIGCPVGTWGGHAGEHVSRSQNAGFAREGRRGELAVIAGAVQALVVAAGELRNMGQGWDS